MIRVLLVDDHPTVRAGLRAVLRAEPGLVPVGAADSVATALTAWRRTAANVVLLDVQMPGGSGLHAARRLKAEADPPRIVLFSAFAGDALLLAGRIAGADAVLGKEHGGHALCETVRRVHTHGRVLPRPPARFVEAGLARLEAEDRALAAMLLADMAPPEVAEVLRIDDRELGHRVERLLGRLPG
jgi:DNA-binding NarL/FixJ family response regulator